MNIEDFLNNHLIRINHSANEIEFAYDGGRYELKYVHIPMDGVSAAIKKIQEWESDKDDEEHEDWGDNSENETGYSGECS